ncbi:MAG: SixA phosphatase family protein [Chitinophagaceae bacterium]
MKTVIIVRHAKSSWADIAMADFDRPLNDRGKKDAQEMAAKLKKKGISIDFFISSPAKRAKKTAQLFAGEFEYPKEKILFLPQLYHAGVSDFIEVIYKLPDTVNTIILFSHNPGITEFVNCLTDTKIDNMPTCAAYAVTLNCNNWVDFEQAKKKFSFLEYPKAV